MFFTYLLINSYKVFNFLGITNRNFFFFLNYLKFFIFLSHVGLAFVTQIYFLMLFFNNYGVIVFFGLTLNNYVFQVSLIVFLNLFLIITYVFFLLFRSQMILEKSNDFSGFLKFLDIFFFPFFLFSISFFFFIGFVDWNFLFNFNPENEVIEFSLLKLRLERIWSFSEKLSYYQDILEFYHVFNKQSFLYNNFLINQCNTMESIKILALRELESDYLINQFLTKFLDYRNFTINAQGKVVKIFDYVQTNSSGFNTRDYLIFFGIIAGFSLGCYLCYSFVQNQIKYEEIEKLKQSISELTARSTHPSSLEYFSNLDPKLTNLDPRLVNHFIKLDPEVIDRLTPDSIEFFLNLNSESLAALSITPEHVSKILQLNPDLIESLADNFDNSTIETLKYLQGLDPGLVNAIKRFNGLSLKTLENAPVIFENFDLRLKELSEELEEVQTTLKRLQSSKFEPNLDSNIDLTRKVQSLEETLNSVSENLSNVSETVSKNSFLIEANSAKTFTLDAGLEEAMQILSNHKKFLLKLESKLGTHDNKLALIDQISSTSSSDLGLRPILRVPQIQTTSSFPTFIESSNNSLSKTVSENTSKLKDLGECFKSHEMKFGKLFKAFSKFEVELDKLFKMRNFNALKLRVDKLENTVNSHSQTLKSLSVEDFKHVTSLPNDQLSATSEQYAEGARTMIDCLKDLT